MKPLASLSLDLDNKWSYMKTHGDAGWESFPSYFEILIPRVLELLRKHELTITFFVVGQDAALDENRKPLGQIADGGHEIGNHSFRHEPWLHLYSKQEVHSELQSAHEAIERATGYRPIGFRGPGFSCSPTVLRTLANLGYRYDASTFPTFLGPLARLYYFMKSNLPEQDLQTRKQLFGKFSEGFKPLKPYGVGDGLIEIPVTTMPLLKIPIHASYVLYLSCYSTTVAMAYFRTALAMCRLTGTPPSILLHPLDFLGCDDEKDLSFFPAMNLPGQTKLALMDRLLDLLCSQCNVVPLRQHAAKAAEQTTRIISASHPAKAA